MSESIGQKAYKAWNAGPGPALVEFYSQVVQLNNDWLGDKFYPAFGFFVGAQDGAAGEEGSTWGQWKPKPAAAGDSPEQKKYIDAIFELSELINFLNTEIFDLERINPDDDEETGYLRDGSWPFNITDDAYWKDDVTPIFISLLQNIKVIQENPALIDEDLEDYFPFQMEPPVNIPALVDAVIDSASEYLKLFPEHSISFKVDIKPLDDTLGLGPAPIFSDINLEKSLMDQGTGWPRTQHSHYIGSSLPDKSSTFIKLPLRAAPYEDKLSMGWNDPNYSYISESGQLKKSNSRDYEGVKMRLGTEIKVVEIISCATGVWVGFVSDDPILNDMLNTWNGLTDLQRRVLYVKAHYVKIKESKIKSDPDPYVSEVSMMGDDVAYPTRKLKGAEPIKPYENQNWVKIQPNDVRLHYYSFNEHNLKLLGKGEKDNVRYNTDSLQKAETLRYSEGYFYFITAAAPRKTEQDIIDEYGSDIEESSEELNSAKNMAGQATISELKETAWNNLLNYLGKNTIGGNSILIDKLKEDYFVLADKKVLFSGNPNNQKALFCIKAAYVDSIPDVRRPYGQDFESDSQYISGRNYAVALYSKNMKQRCDFIVKKLKTVKKNIEGSGAVVETPGGSEYDIQTQIDVLEELTEIMDDFLARQSFPASMNKSNIYDMVQEGTKTQDDNIIQIGVRDNGEVGGRVRETISYVLFSPDPNKLKNDSEKHARLFDFDPYLSEDDISQNPIKKRSALPLRIALPRIRARLEGEYGSRALHLFLAHDKMKQTLANGESDLENNWMEFVSNYFVPPLRIYLSKDPSLLDPEIVDCDELIKKLNESGSNVGYQERILQEKLFNNPKCMEKYFEQYKSDTPATSPALTKKELEKKSEITQNAPSKVEEYLKILYNQFFNVLDTDSLIAMIMACLSRAAGFEFTAEGICEQAIISLIENVGKDPVEKAMLANAFLSPDSEGSKKFIEYYLGEPPFTDMTDEELVDLGLQNANILLDESFNNSPIATSMLMSEREPPAVVNLIKQMESTGYYIELEPGRRPLESQQVSIPYGSGFYDLVGVTEHVGEEYGTYIVPENYTQSEIEQEKKRLSTLGYSSEEARAMMVASGMLKASPAQYEPILASGEFTTNAVERVSRGNMSGLVKQTADRIDSSLYLSEAEEWLEYMKKLLGGITGLCELVVGDVLEGIKDLIRDPGAFFDGGASNWAETFWEKIKKQFQMPSFRFKFPEGLMTDNHTGDYYEQLFKMLLGMIAMILAQILNLLIKDALEKCLEEDDDMGPAGKSINKPAPIPFSTLDRIEFPSWPGLPDADLVAWVQDIMESVSTKQLCSLLRGDATKNTLRTCLEITKERHPDVYQVRDPSGELIMSRIDTIYEVRVVFKNIGDRMPDLEICNLIESPLPDPLFDSLCEAVFDYDARCQELMRAGLTEQECQEQIDKEIDSLKNKVKGLTDLSLFPKNMFNPFETAMPSMCGPGGSFVVPPGIKDTMERTTDNMLNVLKGSLIIDMTNLKFFANPPRALAAMTDPSKLKEAHGMFKDAVANPYTKECIALIGDPKNHRNFWQQYGSQEGVHLIHPITYNRFIHYGNFSTFKARDTTIELAGLSQEQGDEIIAVKLAAYEEKFAEVAEAIIDDYEKTGLQDELGTLIEKATNKQEYYLDLADNDNFSNSEKEQYKHLAQSVVNYRNQLHALRTKFNKDGVIFENLFESVVTVSSPSEEITEIIDELAQKYNNFVERIQTRPAFTGISPWNFSEDFEDDFYDELLDSDALDDVDASFDIEESPHFLAKQHANEEGDKLYQEYVQSYDPSVGSIEADVVDDLFHFSDDDMREQIWAYYNHHSGLMKPWAEPEDMKKVHPLTVNNLMPYAGWPTIEERLESLNDSTPGEITFLKAFFRPIIKVGAEESSVGYDPSIWNPLLGYKRPESKFDLLAQWVGQSLPGLNDFVYKQFSADTKPVHLEQLCVDYKQMFRLHGSGGTMNIHNNHLINSIAAFPGNINRYNLKNRHILKDKVWPLDTKLKDISKDPNHWYAMLRNYTGVGLSPDWDDRRPPYEFFLPEILDAFDPEDPDSFYNSFTSERVTRALFAYWDEYGGGSNVGSDTVFEAYSGEGAGDNEDNVLHDSLKDMAAFLEDDDETTPTGAMHKAKQFLLDQLGFEDDEGEMQFVRNDHANYPSALSWFNWIRISPGLRRLWPIMLDLYNNTDRTSTMYFPKDTSSEPKMAFHPVAYAFMELTLGEAIGLEPDRLLNVFPNLVLPKMAGVILGQDAEYDTYVVPRIRKYNAGPVPTGGHSGGSNQVGTTGTTADVVKSEKSPAFDSDREDQAAWTIFPHMLVFEEAFRDPEAPYNSTDPNKIIEGFSGMTEKISDELASFLDATPNYLSLGDASQQAQYLYKASTLEAQPNFNPNILEYKLPFTEIMSKALEATDDMPAIPAQEKSDEIMAKFASMNPGDSLQELADQLEAVNLNRSLVNQNIATVDAQVWTDKFTKVSKFIKGTIYNHKGYAGGSSKESWHPVVSDTGVSETIYNFNFGAESADEFDEDIKNLLASVIGTPGTLQQDYPNIFDSSVEKLVDPYNYKAQIFGKFLTNKFVEKYDKYYNQYGTPPDPEYVSENYENMKVVLNRALSRYGYSALQYAYSTQVFAKLRNSRLNTRNFMKKLWKKILKSPINGGDIDPRCAALFDQLGAPSINTMEDAETDFFELDSIKEKIIKFYEKSLCYDVYENTGGTTGTEKSLLHGMVTMITKIYPLEMIMASLISWDSIDIVDAFKDKALISVIIQNIEEDYDIEFVSMIATEILQKEEGMTNIDLAMSREHNSALEYLITKEVENISGIVNSLFVNSFPLKTDLQVSLIKNSDPDFLKDFEENITSNTGSAFRPTEYKKLYEEGQHEFVIDARMKNNIYTMNYGDPKKTGYNDGIGPATLVSNNLQYTDVYGLSKTLGDDGRRRHSKQNKNYFHSLPMDHYYNEVKGKSIGNGFVVKLVGEEAQEWAEWGQGHNGPKKHGFFNSHPKEQVEGVHNVDELNRKTLGHSIFEFDNNPEKTYLNILNSKLGNVIFQPYVRIIDWAPGEERDFKLDKFSEYDATGAPCVGADLLATFDMNNYIEFLEDNFDTKRIPENNALKCYMYDYVPLSAWSYFYNHIFLITLKKYSVTVDNKKFYPLQELYNKYGLAPFFKKISFGMRMTYTTTYPIFDHVRHDELNSLSGGESLLNGFDFEEFLGASFGPADSSLRRVKSLFTQRPTATSHTGKLVKELQIPIVEIEKEINFLENIQKFTIGESDSFNITELGTTVGEDYSWHLEDHPINMIANQFDSTSEGPEGNPVVKTMSDVLLKESNSEIMNYLVNNFQQFFYKNLANEFLQEIKESAEFKLMFEYLFPMRRYMAMGVVTCSDSISKFIPEPTFILEDTKKSLKLIIQNLVTASDWREVPDPIKNFLADFATMKEMGTTGKEPNLTKEILRLILRTPLLVLKGFVEVTDPAVIAAKLIIDISNAIVFTTLNLIKTAIATAKSIINTGIQTSESIAMQSEISLSMSVAMLPAVVESLQPPEIKEKITIETDGPMLEKTDNKWEKKWKLEIESLGNDAWVDEMSEEDKQAWEDFRKEFKELQGILNGYADAKNTLESLKEQKKKLEEEWEKDLQSAEDEMKKVYQSPFLLPGLWAALFPPLIPLGGGIVPPPFPGGPFPSTVPGMIYIALLLIDAIEEKTHDDLKLLEDPNCEDQL